MIQSEPEVHKVYITSDTSFCFFALSPVPDYVKATVETVLKIHETEDDGDVLAFLTGQVSGCIFNSSQPFLSRRMHILTPTLCWLFYSCIGNFSPFSSFPLMFFFSLGRGGESCFPSPRPSEDSVTIRHEETPQNFAHVLRSALRWPDEGLWEGALLCSQGKCSAVLWNLI